MRCAFVVNYDLVSHKFALGEFLETEYVVCFLHLQMSISIHMLNFVISINSFLRY